jgi:iron complex transport system ATP-binding protein
MTLLMASGLCAFYGSHEVLKEVDISVAAGEVLGIIGTNGAGKTTLLRLLAGLYLPQSGEVLLDEKPLTRVADVAKKLSYLEQRSQCHWPLQVEQLVALGRLPHQGYGRRLLPEDIAAIEQAMAEADVEHLRHRPVTALSAGEQARVFLARALSVEPQVLLADEPVSGLDPAHQLAVMELLQRKAQHGMGVVTVLHDLTLAARYCHRLVLLHESRVLATGSPKDVLTMENLYAALHIDAVLGEHKGMSFVIPWQPV